MAITKPTEKNLHNFLKILMNNDIDLTNVKLKDGDGFTVSENAQEYMDSTPGIDNTP